MTGQLKKNESKRKKRKKAEEYDIISTMSLEQAKSQWIYLLIAFRHELCYIFW